MHKDWAAEAQILYIKLSLTQFYTSALPHFSGKNLSFYFTTFWQIQFQLFCTLIILMQKHLVGFYNIKLCFIIRYQTLVFFFKKWKANIYFN